MPLPSTHELEGVIVDIISGARDDGQLSKLTVRIVRQKLAIHFNLEEDVLNGETYKSFIKTTVHATVNSLQNAPEAEGEAGEAPPQPKVAKKDKSGGTTKTGSRKRGAKVKVRSLDKAPQEDASASASESEAPPPKKPTARSKPPKPAKSSKTSKKPESEMKYKSKAIIESSDEDAAPESKIQRSTRSPKERKTVKSSPKQKQQKKDDSDVEMDSMGGPGPSSSSSKPKHVTESPKPSISKAKELDRDPMESELSSVIDEPPKKRQKQEKESTKPPKEEKAKRGKKKEELSKDEETVNKLKGIVVACGVRKVWKKEFEGLNRPSQQIKRLHSILGELGMTPRYSIEKAKAIREERELAQELKDVQEFAKATKKRGKAPCSSSETEESADRVNSDANAPARKKNARASIMAFLQDQSEEE